jgi:hypothetical protein
MKNEVIMHACDRGYKSDVASRKLLNTVPSVYLEPSKSGLIVSTECLETGDEEIIGNQLLKLFKIA